MLYVTQRNQVHDAPSRGLWPGLHQEQLMLPKHYKAMWVVKEPRGFLSSEPCIFIPMSTSGKVPPCFLGT